MSGFNDPYPSYEHLAHHSEAEGKVKRKKLWNVFWIMLGITIFELIVGFKAESWHLAKSLLMVGFIGLTIAKAGFIVLSFMHLGDEDKSYKKLVLIPFAIFVVYIAFMVDLGEGSYSKEHRAGMDKSYFEQKANAGHHGSHKAEEHSTEKKKRTKRIIINSAF